jgi:ABC-2 type transport system ATP-binding protein
LIEVHGLTKYYGPKKAIDDVSFEVEKGEILGFLGPNGAGKTTTMRILTCFMPASAGSATVAGYDVFEESREVRRRIGYLPEIPPLYDDMTVDYYLGFVATIKEVDPGEKERRIDGVVDRCGLDDVRGEIVGHLSKGYRQRVGLAQALVHDPEVLVLDEPTIGLDPKQIKEVRQLIKELSGDHTVILSTHILPEVSMTCGRVVIINEGRVTAVDRPANLTRKLKGADRIHVEVSGPKDEIVPAIRGIAGVRTVEPVPGRAGTERLAFEVEGEPDREIGRDLAAAIVGKGWDLHELRPVDMTLEDVFLKLTTKEEGAA